MWHTQEKEAYAIVKGIQKFDRFVRSCFVKVITDYQFLQWLLKSTKEKMARWACLLSEYKLLIIHKYGKQIYHC